MKIVIRIKAERCTLDQNFALLRQLITALDGFMATERLPGFIRLRFKVISPITNLDFYHGIYWSAMLRDWIRPYTEKSLAELGIYPVPLHNGIMEFAPDDIIALDMAVRSDSSDFLLRMLEDEMEGKSRAQYQAGHNHFQPGASISLQEYAWLYKDPANTCLDQELALLSKQDCWTLVFHSPLRLKPESSFKQDMRFLDPMTITGESFFKAFCRDQALECDHYPELLCHSFIWLDVHYEKTLGGLLGSIRISNPKDPDLGRAIIKGQYTGIGKNRAFGFGFYYIEESKGFRAVKPSFEIATLFKRSAELSNLRAALESMKSSSPGPDNIAKEDLISAGKPYLENARKQLLRATLPQGESLVFKKRSHNGNYRLIRVANIAERHILLAILRQIEASVERLLSPSCYSYRKGRDYHQAARAVYSQFRKGFSLGIKADISGFFDAIPHARLSLLLIALFYHDSIYTLMESNLLSGTLGIPQGNPLSPVLSNLYLIPFDRVIKQNGWQMIRYADDFCILSDSSHSDKLTLERVTGFLNKLDLSVSEEKTTVFKSTEAVDFCGYRINASSLSKIKAPKPEDDYRIDGIPAFQDDIAKGKPLYLTFKDSYAKIDNNSIYIQNKDGTRNYAIKEISRIIVVGRPRVSAGLIQQAMIRGKPVSFLSITGKSLGGFAQSRKLFSIRSVYNPVVKDWDSFSLAFARSIVAAKIHNQRTVLKQNKIDEPRLKELELSLPSVDNHESLRGKEGAASVIYWAHFRKLVAPLDFPRRAYHPPEGPVNCLLSLGYSILYFRLAECLMAIQINPWEGVFHEQRGMHMALASDLIEPFRFLVDRIVLFMIHNKQISKDDFIRSEYSSFERLSPQAMRKYIHRFEHTMRTEVKIGDESLTWALVMDRSAGKLLQSLRLGIDFRANRLG